VGLIDHVKTFSAHFDGKHVVLDEPVMLAPNTAVTVVIKDEDETDAHIATWCAGLAQESFNKIWDNPLDADYDKA
jgi:hypothetical protein